MVTMFFQRTSHHVIELLSTSAPTAASELALTGSTGLAAAVIGGCGLLTMGVVAMALARHSRRRTKV
ncbi:MAG: hypothetical protein ACRCSP_08650 [Rhodoglobus sp.]